ncbi:MAG: hypothetical protein N3A53_00680 [Verrucomicrobiae bacterium]|nr:hypothetical protein [Verrucomicrobiae bacterium]
MSAEVEVPETVLEKTYIGRVRFPINTPERLAEWIEFPEDLFAYAPRLGLSDRAVKLLLAMLQGRWALTTDLDSQRWAIQTGMSYAELDHLLRDLISKNYAELGADRVNLYRLWVCLLHLKGVRFITAR